MPNLIVKRESNIVGTVAPYAIYLDNTIIGEINNSQSVEIKINSGTHTLYLRNNLVRIGKSNVVTFTATASSSITVMVKSVITKLSGIQIEVLSNNFDSITDNMDKFTKLQKLNDLKLKKVISDDEYNTEKRKIMGN